MEPSTAKSLHGSRSEFFIFSIRYHQGMRHMGAFEVLCLIFSLLVLSHAATEDGVSSLRSLIETELRATRVA